MTRVFGGVVLISALAAVALAIAKSTVPSWALLGFQGVLIVAGASAIFFAPRRSSRSPAMGLVCIAGTIALASAFAYFGARGAIEVANSEAGISLKPWLGIHTFVALALSASAAFMGLRGSREGAVLFRKGLLAAVPHVALLAAWWLFGSTLAGVSAWLRGSILTIAALAVAMFLCMSVNWLIRAFEVGRQDQLGRE